MITHLEGQQQPPATVPYAAYARERERRIKAEELLAWERKLWQNPKLNPAHKLELVAMRQAVERGTTHDDQGRTRINLTTLAEQIGMSPDTLSRGLRVFHEQIPGLADVVERIEIQENGERWTRKYIRFDDELLTHPEQITPLEPRKHGGARYVCPKCGGESVTIKRTVALVCRCGHESIISESIIDQPPAQQPDGQAGEPGRILQDIPKPDTPPVGGSAWDGQDPGPARDHPGEEDDLVAGAELLLAIAGPGDEHIEMSRRGAKKYYTVDRPIALADARGHLSGIKTRGAQCSYPDGRTRALCWDSDDIETWELLQRAARQLAEAGCSPLLEESPADRGGHLWVIFDDLVDASAARRHVHSLAPELAGLAEYWPGPHEARRWNKVRLPGGRYVRPEVDEWCSLTSVADGEVSWDGRSAASLLLAHQTKACVVPALVPAVTTGDDTAAAAPVAGDGESPRERPAFHIATDSLTDDGEPGSIMRFGSPVDEHWHERYGTEEGRRLWFGWSSQYLAAWWNDRHSVDELLPSERSGYGLASWRGERTPSVAKRDEHWTDFGAGARRSDGGQDGGDALELAARLNAETGCKTETMRQAARELLEEARRALEAAAGNGEALPAWLEEIVTDAGRDHYQLLLERNGTMTDEEARLARRERDVPVPEPDTPEALVAPLADWGAEHRPQEPCSACGCTLYWTAAGDLMCARCLPMPRITEQSRERVARLFPRKSRGKRAQGR